jgi:hypothetical protein
MTETIEMRVRDVRNTLGSDGHVYFVYRPANGPPQGISLRVRTH